jgi:hypothetical protein
VPLLFETSDGLDLRSIYISGAETGPDLRIPRSHSQVVRRAQAHDGSGEGEQGKSEKGVRERKSERDKE